MSKSSTSDEFFKYLIDKRKFSLKTSRDIISRCRRIETVLQVDIESMTANSEVFSILNLKVQDYCEQITINDKARYALVGTLRFAIRRYAEFRWGDVVRNYPRFYKISLAKTKSN